MCLRCRYEARAADRKRRYLVVARVGIAASGVVVAISLLIGAMMAIAPATRSTEAREATQAGTVVQAAVPRASVTRVAEKPAPSPAAKLEPRIAEGRRDFADSVFAIREGLQVTVHFDTELLRTRHDWKFERVVRSTLPLVFGSAVRAALDSIPAGLLAAGGDLLTELPSRGIDVPVGEGQTLRVYPVIRPGQDGPLVVAYRASTASTEP